MEGAATDAGALPTGQRPDLGVLADPARVAAVERVIAGGASTACVRRLTVLAARLLGTCCAQVSLLGERDQLVAAAVGVPWSEGAPRTPLEDSLCSVTAALARPLVVEDAAGHPWVQDLPPVTSGTVSAYLGVVLTDAPGNVLGSLCVYGDEPRSWSPADVDALTAVAEAVADELEDNALRGWDGLARPDEPGQHRLLWENDRTRRLSDQPPEDPAMPIPPLPAHETGGPRWPL